MSSISCWSYSIPRYDLKKWILYGGNWKIHALKRSKYFYDHVFFWNFWVYLEFSVFKIVIMLEMRCYAPFMLSLCRKLVVPGECIKNIEHSSSCHKIISSQFKTLQKRTAEILNWNCRKNNFIIKITYISIK